MNTLDLVKKDKVMTAIVLKAEKAGFIVIPESLHFCPVDGYADDKTKTIVLDLRQRI